MTGYGRATALTGNHSLTVQVSSVNRKTLDLTVKLPDSWEVLEASVGELVRKFALRGKIHVDVELLYHARPQSRQGARVSSSTACHIRFRGARRV